MALKNKFYNHQTRLFLLIVIFTWILAATFFALQYTREREFKIKTLDSHLQIVNLHMLNRIEKGEPLSIEWVKDIFKDDSLRVSIIDLNGNVKFDTSGDVNTDHSKRKEIDDALKYGNGYTLRRLSEVNNKEYFYSATKGDSIIVRSALPYNVTLNETLRVDPVYLWVIGIISVILCIIAFFATKRISQSVKNLRDFADQAEKGNILDYNTDSFPDDELGDISSHIINLYKNIQKANKERDTNMRNALHEEQEKIRIKHQLTNNINHEIKTPVHAIQACLETIVSNKDRLDKDTIVSLVEKSYNHVIRLCELLQDIATITHLGDGDREIERVPTNINSIISRIKDEVALLPPEKQMRVNVILYPEIIINGNSSLLEAVFRNLVNNSIAYSGGRDIFIESVEETEEYYKFIIYDNGIGVDDEHLPRLFERFYRIDSGRSRKLGGTGLGLAIVKNSVIFHGGSISIRNRHNGGLEFTFTLHK